MVDEVVDTIRLTEKELTKEGYELLQTAPDLWIKKTAKTNYFKVIIRCPHCQSLLDCSERLLEVGMVWHETPKCRDCNAWCKSVKIEGREAIMIKKVI